LSVSHGTAINMCLHRVARRYGSWLAMSGAAGFFFFSSSISIQLLGSDGTHMAHGP
jgi:hypothetical protein